MRLLIIEDDPTIAGFVRQGLEELGYVVDVAGDGRTGEAQAASGEYDVIILDIMLPEQSGIEVCRHLRQRGVATPILMLTALSSTGNKVEGLQSGADDYLVKPFDFEEFAARVQALFRRGQATEASVLRFDDLEMDLLKRQVTRAGKKIHLTAKEFALLEYFLRRPNRVLTRTNIGQQVWDINFEYSGNVIEVYVSTLRRKIDKGFDRPLIHTVIGAGYMLSTELPNA
jgi:two-component system copper resistance phosphate regulon response regulator CusR